MSRNIITLTTDFGNSFFTGILKGVILSINNNIQLVDISHKITKFNIDEARFIIENSYKYFPLKTIHLIVIDPAVGTKRKPLIVETDEYFFIAPDNGILNFLESDVKGIYEIIYEKNVSSTFHGRDIFAPAAAKLSIGIDNLKIAKPILKEDTETFNKSKASKKEFKVIFIDDFGNIFLNLKKDEFFNIVKENKWKLKYKHLEFYNLKDNYFSVQKGEFLLLINSFDYIEIASREGNAARQLNAKIGDEFFIELC